MRNLIKLLTVAAMLFAVGCQKYNDTPLKNRVGELENRVTALEELCKKMNTNISSLQTIVGTLQNNDYVTSVTPVTKNGETIGYTIAFSKSAPITIYHGENGKDGINGADGKDGHTPVIGVRQDTDGVYYWTLDGEWLLDGAGNKIKAEGRDGQNGADGKDGINGSDGKDGQDGKDGVNGSDGKDGENGADGKDGITPQLKIENGYWFVSTDNGATWMNLGKATGEDGKDGIDGDSMFQSVTQDEDNVYFTLADGTIITIPKKPRLAISFAEGTSLTFDVDETKTVNYTISGGNSNNIVKAEMLNNDGNYTLYTSSTSATKGTIKITAKIPTANRVIVSVSDGNHTIMTAIDVTRKPSFNGKVVTVETPGTLAKLIADYDKTTISELTVIGNLNDNDISTLNNLPNLTVLDLENVNLEELPGYAFNKNESMSSLKLPKTLKIIGGSAFWYCYNLANITIPDSITEIGSYAFYGCNNLTSVHITDIAKWCTIKFASFANPLICAHNLYLNGELVTNLIIPDNVTLIESEAFYRCSSLTSITIPNSITSIGYNAFRECTGLTQIYCNPATPPTLGSSVFDNISSDAKIYVPAKSVDAYKTAQYWSIYADKIVGYEF